jgi:hypothetical protein
MTIHTKDGKVYDGVLEAGASEEWGWDGDNEYKYYKLWFMDKHGKNVWLEMSELAKITPD